jgi:hypothetical protein
VRSPRPAYLGRIVLDVTQAEHELATRRAERPQRRRELAIEAERKAVDEGAVGLEGDGGGAGDGAAQAHDVAVAEREPT